MKKQTPIAWCPVCDRAVLYSSDPKQRSQVTVRVAGDDDRDRMIRCAKCGSMLIQEDEPSARYVTIPCLGYVQC